MNGRRLLSTASLAGAFLLPAAAAARDINPEGIPVGHRAVGMGGAYTAVGGDGVALWYNPAGLGSLRDGGISANVTVYQWRAQTLDRFADFGNLEGQPGVRIDGDGALESGDFSSVPSSLVLSLPLSDPDAPVRHGIAGGLFVPDDDAYAAKTSTTLLAPGVASAQFKARDVHDERSYWIGGGYGVDAGRWAFGVSAFAVAHLYQRAFIASFFSKVNNDVDGLVATRELDTTDVTAVVQAGVLYRSSDALTIGLTLRSPSLGRLYHEGQTLVISSREVTGEPTFIDRHESDDLEVEHRLPLRASLGFAWRPSSTVLLTADLRYIGPVEPYEVIETEIYLPRGPDGEVLDLPADQLRDRAVNLTTERERTWTVNGAVGAEIRMSEKVLLRLGAYTDRSTVDDLTPLAPLDYRVDIFSGVLGIGYIGERGSTDIGVIYRQGTGEALSPFASEKADVEITSVGVYLAGSADL